MHILKLNHLASYKIIVNTCMSCISSDVKCSGKLNMNINVQYRSLHRCECYICIYIYIYIYQLYIHFCRRTGEKEKERERERERDILVCRYEFFLHKTCFYIISALILPAFAHRLTQHLPVCQC